MKKEKTNNNDSPQVDAVTKEEIRIEAVSRTETDAEELDQPLTNRGFLIGCAYIAKMIDNLIDAKLNGGANINRNDPGEDELEDMKSVLRHDKEIECDQLYEALLKGEENKLKRRQEVKANPDR